MKKNTTNKIIKGRKPYRLSELQAKHGNLDDLFFGLLNEFETIEEVAKRLTISRRTVERYIANRFTKHACWKPTQYAKLTPQPTITTHATPATGSTQQGE